MSSGCPAHWLLTVFTHKSVPIGCRAKTMRREMPSQKDAEPAWFLWEELWLWYDFFVSQSGFLSILSCIPEISAIVGELVAIHELQSRLRYKFHVSRVLQSGHAPVKARTDQNYLWPKNLYKRCGCGLQVGHKYIIAGHHNHKDTKMVLKMDSYIIERAGMRDAIRMKSFLRACKNL